MAKQTSNYNCILYEPGDKVREKHGEDEVLEIEATRIGNVGLFTCQFLRFKDKEDDIGCFSNLYIPVGETIEKYKDGLKYLDEVKVRSKQVEKGIKIHKQIEKKIKQDNSLTPEDLKPHYVAIGTFNGRAPINKEGEK
jgi:hypothetical protein